MGSVVATVGADSCNKGFFYINSPEV